MSVGVMDGHKLKIENFHSTHPMHTPWEMPQIVVPSISQAIKFKKVHTGRILASSAKSTCSGILHLDLWSSKLHEFERIETRAVRLVFSFAKQAFWQRTRLIFRNKLAGKFRLIHDVLEKPGHL